MVELTVFAGVSFSLACACLAVLAYFLIRSGSNHLTQANAIVMMAKLSQEIDDRVKARVKVVNTVSTPSGTPAASVASALAPLQSYGSDMLVEEQPPDMDTIRQQAIEANRWLNQQQAQGVDLRGGDTEDA